MITQIGITRKGDLHQLEVIYGDRPIVITLTNDEVKGLYDLLRDHLNGGDNLFMKFFSINLN